MTDYSVDWTTAHKMNFEKCFASLEGNVKKALEVGCYEGRTTLYMAENFLNQDGQVLYAIDPHPKELFFEKTKHLTNQGKIVFEQGHSYDLIPKFKASFFDFIYLDGSHLGKSLMEDLTLCWRRLRVGGIILVDDYQWDWQEYIERLFDLQKVDANPQLFRSVFFPKKAVDSFMEVFSPEIEVLINDYQIAFRKLKSIEDCMNKNQKMFCP